MSADCLRVSVESEIRLAGPGISPVYHAHAEIECNLVVAGRGTYFLDDARHDLSPGTLIWLLPNQSHRLLPGSDLKMWVVVSCSDRCDPELIADAARHQCRMLARDDALALDRLFSHITQDADEPRLYRSGLDYALRSARHVSATGSEPATARLHPAVTSALRLLRDWPDVPNAGALAAKCGVSQHYLRELLLGQTGRGFVEWRNRSRLERFQVLYPESGDLLATALAAGFGSYVQFHRVFLEVVGTTPGDWAKAGDGRRQGASPPIIETSPALDRTSTRMIWYPLAEITFKDAARWIGSGFAAEIEGGKIKEEAPIPSFVTTGYDLRKYESALVEDLAGRDADNGERLRKAFSRSDIFSASENILGQYGYRLDDLGVLVAIHLSFAVAFIHRTSHIGKAEFDRLCARVKQSLNQSRSFAAAGREDRQRAAAAICAQAYFLRCAIVAARANGRDVVVERVKVAAERTLIATYGWSPRASGVVASHCPGI